MKDTKTELKFFSVPEWKKEENYLREQHKNGWEFVNVSGFGLYHFKKCQPKDVVYQLDYNPDSVSNKAEYVRCSATADGNICRIMSATAISARMQAKWAITRRFSATMNRALI